MRVLIPCLANATHPITDEATFSKRCYPRTSLPGCKGKLYRFEREMLRRCYVAAFSIAPAHILNIFVALICANHVNRYVPSSPSIPTIDGDCDRTFGKGLMPRPYRLKCVVSQFLPTPS